MERYTHTWHRDQYQVPFSTLPLAPHFCCGSGMEPFLSCDHFAHVRFEDANKKSAAPTISKDTEICAECYRLQTAEFQRSCGYPASQLNSFWVRLSLSFFSVALCFCFDKRRIFNLPLRRRRRLHFVAQRAHHHHQWYALRRRVSISWIAVAIAVAFAVVVSHWATQIMWFWVRPKNEKWNETRVSCDKQQRQGNTLPHRSRFPNLSLLWANLILYSVWIRGISIFFPRTRTIACVFQLTWLLWRHLARLWIGCTLL